MRCQNNDNVVTVGGVLNTTKQGWHRRKGRHLLQSANDI
jgi:hypothetical protein